MFRFPATREASVDGVMLSTYDKVFDDLVICKESFLHTAC